jgi:hypothetical protein
MWRRIAAPCRLYGGGRAEIVAMRKFAIVSLIFASVGGCADDAAPNFTKLESAIYNCASGPNISVEANNRSFALDGVCDRIMVKGAGNKFTIAKAKNIEIFGDNNIVDVDAVDRLRVHSKGNTIRYRTGFTGVAADVVTLGDNNAIHQLK